MRGLLLLAVAVCGCGFEPVQVLSPGDLAGADLAPGAVVDLAGVDLAGVDLAGVDLATPPGADLSAADLASAPCNLPQLLVTVENLKNSGTGGGRVARLQLDNSGNLPQSCSTLSAQGGITAQPFSVAQVDTHLAVEGIDDLQLIDPGSDTMVWSKPNASTDFPVDVFALHHPDGRVLAAAAWGNTGQSMPAITHVDAWAADATLVKSWMTNGADLPLGLGIYGMTSDPMTPTHLLAVDPDNNDMAWDVDPWSASKTVFLGSGTGAPSTIYADVWTAQSVMRVVWVDSTAPTGVLYNNDSGASGLLGPIRCAGCTLLHAVPDPTDNLRFFGLCDGPSVDARRVVRFSSSGGTCDTVLDGAGFGAQSRLSRLAIAE
jgi:hypothetical protein